MKNEKTVETLKARVYDVELEACAIKQAALNAINSEYAIESLADFITDHGDVEGVLTHIGNCVGSITLDKENAATTFAAYRALVAIKQGHVAKAKWKALIGEQTKLAFASILGKEVMRTNNVTMDNFIDAVDRVARHHELIALNADIGLLAVARSLGETHFAGISSAIPFTFQTEQEVAQSQLVQSGDTAGNKMAKRSYEVYQDKGSFSHLVNEDWVDAQINLVRFTSLKQLGVIAEKKFDCFSEHMAEKLWSGKVGKIYHALSTTYYNLPMNIERTQSYVEYLNKTITEARACGGAPYAGNYKDKDHNIEAELVLQQEALVDMENFKEFFEGYKFFDVLSSAAELMRENDAQRPLVERKNINWTPYCLAVKFTAAQFEATPHSAYIGSLVEAIKQQMADAGFCFERKEFGEIEWYETGTYSEDGAVKLAAFAYQLRAAMRGVTDVASIEAAQAVADSIDAMNTEEFNSAF